MEFKNYCIVVMGQTDGVLTEINKVSEKLLGIMDGKGLVISTFVSNMEINELTDFFKESKRNFLLFTIDSKTSGFNFLSPKIQEELFSKIEPNELKEMTSKLINELKINKIDKNLVKKEELSEEQIKKLSKDDRDAKISEILDKGTNNLNDYDKDLLDKLSRPK